MSPFDCLTSSAAPISTPPPDAAAPTPRARWHAVAATARRAAHSRTALVVGVVVSLLIPALTLPKLPAVTWWPLLLGLLPWVLGKSLLCPLRGRALPDAGLSRRWHLRAYAESELLGLLTPGHVGADLWRMRRLTGVGLGRGDAVLSVGVDRFVGALGLALLSLATLWALGRPWIITAPFPLWGSVAVEALGWDEPAFWRYWEEPTRIEALFRPILADRTTA